ncbi:MAG TPA: deoxyribodipyrimidine photo-lyase [Thiolinea sp.]|nr:deoxyribodipyrimidine photo-lyase [Thiolinea sp.]
MSRALVWLRQDLRLADNPALWHALQQGHEIIPVFIHDPTPDTAGRLGAASQVWLHHTLAAMAQSLAAMGSRLILRRGEALTELVQLQTQTGAQALYWNRCYDPVSVARDTHIKQVLGRQLTVHSFNASLLHEPVRLLKADGAPYRVFTAWWKTLLQAGLPARPLPAPDRLPVPAEWPPGCTLAALGLLPAHHWPVGMMAHWKAGEQAAWQVLDRFLEAAAGYAVQRDFPGQAGTSCLSPYLHSGSISPQQIVAYCEDFRNRVPQAETGIAAFVRELGWRDFAAYLLWHFPRTLEKPLDTRFETFPWSTPDEYGASLQRWQRGMTGFPIVDAGMRQLWQSGWMHNRVRMIAASLLCKNLLIPWQQGEHWFRDTLVDADLASNVLGWQWVAGCGADAAPYFRIFNPVLQAQKFDPDGTYVRRWVPELRERPVSLLHQPLGAGEVYGAYPLPVADLKASRQRALACFARMKSVR